MLIDLFVSFKQDGNDILTRKDYNNLRLSSRIKMQSPTITIQYLEDSPYLSQLDVSKVVDRLRAAAECLHLTHLLIGWHLPAPLLEACRMEAEHLGVRFLRWQPLLTTDKVLIPDSSWQTEGLMGNKVAGYRGLPEFTFVCPNHPAVQDAVYTHLDKLVRQGIYQGFFLDRVRFPSPSTDPINDLTCFCEHCQHKAADYGLDLKGIRAEILQRTLEEKGRLSLIKTLLSGRQDPVQADWDQDVIQFLTFRRRSVCDLLAFISQPLRQAHLEIGVDCYSPSLTNMVGQDLNTMSEFVDWIKLMAYAHTFAPAGIPFELTGVLHYLSTTTRLSERQALVFISQSIGLPLPESRVLLEKTGLSTIALEKEVKRGVDACSVPVLAGIELVDLEGVTRLNPDQIQADLTAMKRAGSAGLAISWDLLHIPLDRLDLIRKVYLGSN
jgi:hypothetical protein